MAKKLIPQQIKNIYHFFQAILANLAYGWPSRKIKIIGVTGTNGKTTTCQMIARILEEAGKKVALASTINFKIGEREWVNDTKFTTLSAFSVQKFIKQAVEAGCEYLVLETSSHSLDQNRVWGVKYETAVITNVTREHLDYHKTMEQYRAAKLKLFKNIKVAMMNLDMERPEEFLDCGAEKIFRYSAEKTNDKYQNLNQIVAEDIQLEIRKTSFKVKDIWFKLNLPGKFNLENALGAVCVGLSEEISLEDISMALEKIKGVPGRMESVPNDKNLNIIIDYAVTPDSLEKLYGLIKNLFKVSKIIAVFGSCGERDRGKRPMMGEIVARYADRIILTNEDPYGEDPMQIINEVAEGIKDKNKLEIIQDRREAIRKALQIARFGDIILVTGKGAEEIMAIGKERIPWNDRKVILEELKNIV